MQTTIRKTVRFSGVGLHTGVPVVMSIHPAKADEGVRFVRVDVRDRDNVVPARFDHVVPASLCTMIGNRSRVSVKTVEHVMAGLAACGIHNARIELDGPEAPIMDGSALPFATELLKVGVSVLDRPVTVMRIRREISVSGKGGCFASLEPSDACEMDFWISFPKPIGSQRLDENLANGAIVRKLVDSRTFCLRSQIEGLREMGAGRGGDPRTNVLVADDIRNEYLAQFRHVDECVRHKMLDAVGDLALAGHPVIGKFTGFRSGHALTNALLKKLFATPDAFEKVEADAATASGLPGVGADFSDIPVVH